MNYYYWLIWAAVFLALAFFIRNLHIFVNVIYLKKPDNHSLSVSVALFKRLKLYTFQVSPPDFFQSGVPGFKSGGDSPAGAADGQAAEKRRQEPPRSKDNSNLYRRLLDKLAAHLYFDKIYLRLLYGFEDAALTGVSNGVLAALRGVFLALCGAYLKLKEQPDISFCPVYGRDRLEVEFNCIFSIRLGKVIAIAASALTSFFANRLKQSKFIQGGETRWRNILFRT